MKKNIKIKLLVLFLIVTNHVVIISQELMIASGAGYKKPMLEIIKGFEQETHIHVNSVFGNLQMVASQASQTGEVACIVGDKRFLKKLEKTVSFIDYSKLGKGVLVLAYRKGVDINNPQDILSTSISSVFMPQDGKAIYGIAGKEALTSMNLYDKVSSKLTQVATVPQVVSYLVTGEADAGFINLTEALANKEKLGGYIIIPHDKYELIEIVAGTVKGFEDKETTKAFVSFIKSDKITNTLTKYGL